MRGLNCCLAPGRCHTHDLAAVANPAVRAMDGQHGKIQDKATHLAAGAPVCEARTAVSPLADATGMTW
jgi:hypothetical protein